MSPATIATNRELALPVVHLNGTSRDALLEGYIDSCNALQHAIEVVQKNGPNARDYYVSRVFAFAQAHHESRLERLASVLAELRQIGEHVAGLT